MVTPALTIGIAGTHASGKTTLQKRIEMELRAQGLTVASTGGLAKRAAALGFPKMQNHTPASTQWIIAAGAAAELETALGADVVLVSRTAHDAVAYYLAALHSRGEVPDPEILEPLTMLAHLHTAHHTLLLATRLDPALPLPDSPHRDPAYRDLAFRTQVDQQLHQLLDDEHIPYREVPSHGHQSAVADIVAMVNTAAALA